MPFFSHHPITRFRIAALIAVSAIAVGVVPGQANAIARPQETPPAPVAGNPSNGSMPWSSGRIQVAYTPPPGFHVNEASTQPDVEFQSDKIDGITPTIVVHQLDISDVSLPEVGTTIIKIASRSYSTMNVTGQAPSRDSNGDECFRIDALGGLADAQGDSVRIQMRLLLVRHQGCIYEFTLTCSPSAFVAQATAFEQSLRSIAWSVPIPAEQVSITNLGISLTVPENWRRIPPGDPLYLSRYALRIAGPIVDGARSIISLTIAPPPPGINDVNPSLIQQVFATVSQARSMVNFRLVAQTPVTVDGVPAAVLDIAAQDRDTGKANCSREVILIRNGQLYNFLLMTRAIGFDATAQAAFASMMTSIRWSQPAAAAPSP